MRIGVISDTHGLLRPEAEAALAGVDHIIHAGDIGNPDIIGRLQAIAPVSAIRGNVDTAPWARAHPEQLRVTLAGQRILVLHDLKDLDGPPQDVECDIIISGHTHRPAIVGTHPFLLNPGSAGPRRFRLPVSLAFLLIGASVEAVLQDLLPPA
jgi:uncharacterized protein